MRVRERESVQCAVCYMYGGPNIKKRFTTAAASDVMSTKRLRIAVEPHHEKQPKWVRDNGSSDLVVHKLPAESLFERVAQLDFQKPGDQVESEALAILKGLKGWLMCQFTAATPAGLFICTLPLASTDEHVPVDVPEEPPSSHEWPWARVRENLDKAKAEADITADLLWLLQQEKVSSGDAFF